MSKIKGGCLCGKVQYTSSAEPAMTAVCHCIDCQKQSGSAFSINIGLRADEINFTGELRMVETHGLESGKKINRYFCPNCGSPLYSAPDVMPGMIFLKVGTLDDTSWVKPDINFWCSTAQPWVSIDGSLPQFPGNPPFE